MRSIVATLARARVHRARIAPRRLLARRARSSSLLEPAARASRARSRQWRAAYDGNLFKRPSPEEMADAATGRLQQPLRPLADAPERLPPQGSTSSTLVLGSDGWRPMAKPAHDPAADAEFDAALKLFQQGKFAEAEKQFARIAKKRKRHPWGENSQYYLAECQFQQTELHQGPRQLRDAPQRLPGDDYMEKLTRREYEIAQLWLDAGRPQDPAGRSFPWYGRFDGRLPIIDVQGSGLKALEHVRQNDPQRPRSPTRRPWESPTTT